MAYSPGGNSLLTATAVTAAFAVVGLSIAQSDAFSRRFLSEKSLQSKRFAEYLYRWDQCIEKALLRAHYALAGGVSAAHAQDMAGTSPMVTKLRDDSEIRDLIEEWIQQDKLLQKQQGGTSKDSASSPFPRILGISREGESREVLLELYHSQSGAYQLPLQKFGIILSDICDNLLTTNTLCFVADASSGLALKFMADLLEASKSGVAVIREPTWMAAIAKFSAERVVSKEKMQRILFGLCRMEALRARDQIGDARTVLFTLPGQAVTPVLLPLLQAAFPEDRHVFAYDSCIASVERAMTLRSQYKRGAVPESLDSALSFGCSATESDPTRITTPLRSSLTKRVLDLSVSLKSLRLYHADVVETWMASVDTFLQLKEDENNNGYLPYTLKMGLLVGNPDGSLEPESDRFYSLSSLLQFLTGCRSRPLPEGVLDAAREWLRDFAHTHHKEMSSAPTKLNAAERKAVENSVFCHKLILIQDKTLKDTVLPTKHWTLKQAAKRGCACCAPEEDEDEDDSQKQKGMFGVSLNPTGTANPGLTNSPSQFVDGKSTFAFDPTKFSAPSSSTTPARPKYVDGKNTFAFDPSKFS